MNTKGIRISDIKEDKCISLSELLGHLAYLEHLNWSVLWLDVTSKKGSGTFIVDLMDKANHSKNGFSCSFTDLIEISDKIFQEIEVLIIGCKNAENIHRYKQDQEMYETCDIVIEMIDGGFWEIFSKNLPLIELLSSIYKDFEFLESDFQNKN